MNREDYIGLLGLLIFLKANPTKTTTPEWIDNEMNYINDKLDQLEIAENESFEEIRKISTQEQAEGYA
jgi:hypothetical protein